MGFLSYQSETVILCAQVPGLDVHRICHGTCFSGEQVRISPMRWTLPTLLREARRVHVGAYSPARSTRTRVLLSQSSVYHRAC